MSPWLRVREPILWATPQIYKWERKLVAREDLRQYDQKYFEIRGKVDLFRWQHSHWKHVIPSWEADDPVRIILDTVFTVCKFSSPEINGRVSCLYILTIHSLRECSLLFIQNEAEWEVEKVCRQAEQADAEPTCTSTLYGHKKQRSGFSTDRENRQCLGVHQE
jgi:hypothetical protein